MRAFHFYIEDWTGSYSISRMDGEEERGYLRLILLAASSSDCSLTPNEKELAKHSLLGNQWNRPTLNETYRFNEDETSGQKILANFFHMVDGVPVKLLTGTRLEPLEEEKIDLSDLVPGRLYNARLLREFQYQQTVAAQRKAASRKGVVSRQSKTVAPQPEVLIDRMVDRPVDRPVDQTVEQNATNIVSVSVTSSLDTSRTDTTEKTPEVISTVVEAEFVAGPPVRSGLQLCRLEPVYLISRADHRFRGDRQEAFFYWFDAIWAPVRGTHGRDSGARAFISVITSPELFAECVECTLSYLASLGDPSRGFNPDNFLFTQHKDRFKGRWPTAGRKTAGQALRDKASADFDRMMGEYANERGVA